MVGEHAPPGQGEPGAKEFELLKRVLSQSEGAAGAASRSPELRRLKEMQVEQRQA